VDAVAVEVSSRAVVVLGGAWVGVAGEDLGVTKRYSGIEGVRDRGVPPCQALHGRGRVQPRSLGEPAAGRCRSRPPGDC